MPVHFRCVPSDLSLPPSSSSLPVLIRIATLKCGTLSGRSHAGFPTIIIERTGPQRKQNPSEILPVSRSDLPHHPLPLWPTKSLCDDSFRRKWKRWGEVPKGISQPGEKSDTLETDDDSFLRRRRRQSVLFLYFCAPGNEAGKKTRKSDKDNSISVGYFSTVFNPLPPTPLFCFETGQARQINEQKEGNKKVEFLFRAKSFENLIELVIVTHRSWRNFLIRPARLVSN